MKRTIVVALCAAACLGLPACLPVAAVPLLQGGLAMAADAFCSPAAAGLRGDIRETVYGDREASVLGDDCK